MATDGMKFQGTTFEVSGAAGAAVETVTAAVGYPTIITKAAHGLSNGDVVTLSAFAGASAALMNTKVVVVENVTTNTLAVDIDTTAGTLTAANGTLTPLAWVTVGEVTDFDGPGGSAAVIDLTHNASTAKEKTMGLPDEGQITLSINFVPSDAGQVVLLAARANQTSKNYRITYEDDTTDTFAGFVLQFARSGATDGKIAGSVTVEITGAVTTA